MGAIDWIQQRHVVVLLCGLSSFVCYADRVNISVAVLHMGLQHMEKGWVLSSFFYGYFCTQIVGGLLATRFGGGMVLNFAVATWSLFTLLTPLAAQHSVTTLVVCRVLMGFGEGMAFPAFYAILSRWVPPSERARSFAVVQVGTKAGTVLALAACPTLISWGGWPSVFYVFGASGFLWNILWVLLVGGAAPAKDYHLTHAQDDGSEGDAEALVADAGRRASKEHSHATGTAASGVTMRVAKQLLSAPPVWAIVAAHVSYNWGHYLVLSWLPTWLNERHGISKESVGLSTIPFAAMSGGVAVWSWVADRWSLRASATTVRKGMTTIGLGGAALFIVAVGQAGTPGTAILFMSITLMLQSASASGSHLNHVDLSPKYSSFLLSISNTAATVPGMIAVPLASAILETSWGRWHHVFGMAACVYSLGLLIYRHLMSAEPLNID